MVPARSWIASGPMGESKPMADVADFTASGMGERLVEALWIEDGKGAGHAAADIGGGAAFHLALAGGGMTLGQALLRRDARQHDAAGSVAAHGLQHGAAVGRLADDDDLER